MLYLIVAGLLLVVYYLYHKNKLLKSQIDSENEYQNRPEDQFEEELSQPEEIPEKITKKLAIEVINNDLGFEELNTRNTNFATLNKDKMIWWFDINPDRFQNDLHLILANKKSFKWIKISKGVVPNPSLKFTIREDKGLVDLVISAQPGHYYLRDTRFGGSGFGFQNYIVKEYK